MGSCLSSPKTVPQVDEDDEQGIKKSVADRRGNLKIFRVH